MAEPHLVRWALLIGAGFYLPGEARRDPNTGRTARYHNLEGAPNDISLIESFLTQTLSMPSDHILKLTSTSPPDRARQTPLEDPSTWPTYQNIKDAFEDLLHRCKKDDFVYIHYSGHGARVRTVHEGLKGPNGFDEALVPVDIQVVSPSPAAQGKYIRDMELADWLQQLVQKGIRLTLALDSCHAGSSNRTSDVYGSIHPRGTGTIDYSVLPTDHPATHPTAALPRKKMSVLRQATLQRNWLLEADGYLLLAACTAFQKAHEFVPEARKHGAFTYYLVESLRTGPRAPIAALMARIGAKLRSRFAAQSPVAEGEEACWFFAGVDELVGVDEVVSVLRVDGRGRKMELDQGELHGVHVGDEYEILRDDGVSEGGGSLKCSVVETRGLNCVAEIADATEDRWFSVEVGSRAILSKPAPGSPSLVRIGDSSTDPPHLATTDVQLFRSRSETNAPLSRLWRPLDLETDQDKTPDLIVTVSPCGQFYHLLDSSQEPLPHLPQFPVNAPTTVATLQHCITHILRYRLVERLGARHNSALRTPCRFEVKGKSTSPPSKPSTKNFSADLSWPGGLLPCVAIDGVHHVTENQYLSVTVRNMGAVPVYVTVFNLKPRWGVRKLYPAGAGRAEPLGAGEKRELPARMDVPEGLRRGADGGKVEIWDTLKAVFTTEMTPLDVLGMPEIGDGPVRGTDAKEYGRTELDALVWLLDGRRDAKVRGRSTGSWQVYEINIRTTTGKD